MKNKVIIALKEDKFIFLKLYFLISIVFLVFKVIISIMDEDIIEEVLRVNISNIIFGTVTPCKGYLFAKFEIIPFAILLVIHWGILIREVLINILGRKKLYMDILCLIAGILLYIVFKALLNVSAPFSLLEGCLLGVILYFISSISIRIKK